VTITFTFCAQTVQWMLRNRFILYCILNFRIPFVSYRRSVLSFCLDRPVLPFNNLLSVLIMFMTPSTTHLTCPRSQFFSFSCERSQLPRYEPTDDEKLTKKVDSNLVNTIIGIYWGKASWLVPRFFKNGVEA
jgi:hypothetical protein